MTEPSSVERASAGRISLSLPAKITGIVFWGMVLVGLLGAVFLLQVREQELAAQYRTQVTLLSHEVENVLQNASQDEPMMTLVERAFEQLQRDYPLQGMAFQYQGRDYIVGEHGADQDAYVETMSLHTHDPVVTTIVRLTVYMPSLKQAISTLRKKMLLIIGSLVFIFGLVLQQILQKVLSRPFLNMVMSAEQFASGDSQVRFDEKRLDEFGYLAKFINRALDSSMQQQRELESSRRALFEEKERAEVTLHSIMDGVITTSAEGRIQYMNPVAERLSGWTNEHARDAQLNRVVRFVDEDSGQRLANPMEKCLQNNLAEELATHAALIRQDGATVPIEASAAPMRNDAGEVVGGVMVFQDVSQARRLTRQLSYQATHDALTGLYNRRMFEDHLQTALVNVQEEARFHALCYVDLDQFKIVNDTCGHMAGDELLRQLGNLLRECVREGDVLARLGGDEFGILLENCHISQATSIANKIRQQVKEYRFAWHDKSFEIGASIGVVAISADNLDMAGLMAAADVACYAAKDMGRNRVHVYEPTDQALAERHGQMHWAAEIMDAIEEERLVLFQQPVFAAHAGAGSAHCEILIRMKADEGDYIKPDAFIPAAERYNLMPRVDRWVIYRVFESIAQNGLPDGLGMVAINLSGTSLADDDLLRYIRSTGQHFAINFNNICFEITETAAISNLAKASHFMRQLKRDGCRFSLDDFGSGLSSFAYLKNLPVDFIKIDGAFVKDLSVDPIDRAMVEAIIKLGHVMDIRTIAEWVEDEQTLACLRDMGVDFVQGFHLGRPERIEHLSKVANL